MTTIRPELSRRNKYYIPKHRYYELKHFCLQYPLWRDAYEGLNYISKNVYDGSGVHAKNKLSDSTGDNAVKLDYWSKRIDMIRKAADNVECGDYIFEAVTKGESFTFLEMNRDIPISRDVYYEAYREFFWNLNKIRE